MRLNYTMIKEANVMKRKAMRVSLEAMSKAMTRKLLIEGNLLKCKLLFLKLCLKYLLIFKMMKNFRPCILIFDSLGGTSRARVVATLRDYLTCEYKVKYPSATLRQYTKSNMVGSLVKVPQQQNFTDCGLFLLQYVEQFFADPIKDFRIPIKSLVNWFHQDLVTRKREDIAILIKKLIKREGFEEVELPVIDFPTKDGKLIEQAENMIKSSSIDEHFEDPDYIPTGEEIKEANQPEEISKKIYVIARKRTLDNNNGNGETSNAKTPKLNKNK